MKRLLFCGILFAFPVTYSLSVQSATIASIINDVFWKTTSGSFIYSQGGGIFRFPDAQGKEHYYWYGVHYRGAVT